MIRHYGRTKRGERLMAGATLRKAAARTLDTLTAAIKAPLNAAPKQECASDIFNAGYST